MSRFLAALAATLVLITQAASVADDKATADKPAEKAAADKAADKATTDKAKKSATPVVAVFRLHGSLSETPADSGMPFTLGESTSLKDLVERMSAARDDKNVKAVALVLDGAEPNTSQSEELRQVIGKIREAGKEVFAHADELSMPSYVLFSGASRLSVSPTADVWITGIHSESPYLLGLLEKVGVEPDFLACGEYKSAAEIFTRKAPSPQAEAMQNWLLDSVFQTQVELIAAGRKVAAEKVKGWVDGGPYTAEKAKELGLIDAVEHREAFESEIKKKVGDTVRFDHKYGKKAEPEVDMSSPMAILSIWSDLMSGGKKKKKSDKDAIAIVYVDGPIVLGTSETSLFSSAASASSSELRKTLLQVADDSSIKAVVLRVDSPGGSAVASEIILDATKQVSAKKPLIVSMGSVAGSGGYYVTCAAKTIFADKSTLTGSIGVVGGKISTGGLWDKLGVNWKSYDRGQNAGLLSTRRAFTPKEKEHIQSWMNEIYGVFQQHVREARGSKLKKDLGELAGGRVFTGQQALELGLVDKIGTLDDALKFAAGEAKLEKYDIRVVPESKSFIEQLFDPEANAPSDKHVLSQLSQAMPSRSGLAALVPELERLDPDRLHAVLTALGRLELLEREGAVIMMPEMTIGR